MVDVIAILTFGEMNGLTLYRRFISLGVDHDGGRLVGISNDTEALRPRLWLADFNQDGIDDILVGTPVGFIVYRMGE